MVELIHQLIKSMKGKIIINNKGVGIGSELGNATSGIFTPSKFESVDQRKYAPGDPNSSINWSTTAKTGELYTNVSVMHQNTGMVIILDDDLLFSPIAVNEKYLELLIYLCFIALKNKIGIKLFRLKKGKHIYVSKYLYLKNENDFFKKISELFTESNTEIKSSITKLIKEKKANIFVLGLFMHREYPALLKKLKKRGKIIAIHPSFIIWPGSLIGLKDEKEFEISTDYQFKTSFYYYSYVFYSKLKKEFLKDSIYNIEVNNKQSAYDLLVSFFLKYKSKLKIKKYR